VNARIEPKRDHPYCSTDGQRWWVVTDTPWEALKVVHEHDENRDYFGVVYHVERKCIRGVSPGSDDWYEFEGDAIEECEYSSDEDAVEAFRVVVVNG
jgi:hypothetical protein